MRAVVITRPGGPEVLEVQEVETPEPIGDYVRVRVRASGVNRADLLQRAGAYPAPPGSPSNIPGLEFAGEVDAVGPLVRAWKPGQRVMGLAGGGGQAQYIQVHEGLLVEIPDNLDFVQAAGVPEVFMTAHDGRCAGECESVYVDEQAHFHARLYVAYTHAGGEANRDPPLCHKCAAAAGQRKGEADYRAGVCDGGGRCGSQGDGGEQEFRE